MCMLYFMHVYTPCPHLIRSAACMHACMPQPPASLSLAILYYSPSLVFSPCGCNPACPSQQCMHAYDCPVQQQVQHSLVQAARLPCQVLAAQAAMLHLLLSLPCLLCLSRADSWLRACMAACPTQQHLHAIANQFTNSSPASYQ
jgi:hypothetical protein